MKKYIVIKASTQEALVTESPITWGARENALKFVNASDAVQKAKDMRLATGEQCGMEPVEE